MIDLITADVLALSMQLDAGDLAGDDNASQAIAQASAVVIDYCRHDFQQHDDETVRLDGRGTTTLLLPAINVSDVSEIVEDPDGDSTTLDVDAYEWGTAGIVRRLDGGVFARRFRWYDVAMTWGYSTVPDAVQGVVARVARRGYSNPDGVSQESLGGYSYSIAATVGSAGYGGAGIGLLPGDLRELAEYRIEPFS